MAAAKKTTTTSRAKSMTASSKATPVAKAAPDPAPKTEEVNTEAVAPAPRKYKDDDLIPCISITSGLLVMVGAKTGRTYRWVDAGDRMDMDYSDLYAEIRTRSNFVFKPRFVIDDDELVNQHPEIVRLYDKLYSKDDLTQILRLPAEQMKKVIAQLPEAVKATLKSMAVTMIDNDTLDSVKTIKAIDEIFGTQMLLRMTT